MREAELKIWDSPAAFRLALFVPRAPATIQAWDSRAKLAIARRKFRSVVKNGAGDSGHAIKLGCGDDERAAELRAALRLIEPKSLTVSFQYSLVQSALSSTGTFSCTRTAVWSVGKAGGVIQRADCRTTTAANTASSSDFRFSRLTRKAVASAVLTTMISNEIPYTPVTVAMRARVTLSTCVVPSRSQGNPVMRSRASSIATQTAGASRRARRLTEFLPASRLINSPKAPWYRARYMLKSSRMRRPSGTLTPPY